MTGTELRALRLRLDLTQQQMADKLYMSKVMYGLNERGDKALSKRTEQLAAILQQELHVSLAHSGFTTDFPQE